MKLIPLTKGQLVMVDDADYEWLMQWKWYAHRIDKTNKFYAKRSEWDPIKRKNISYYMHSFIVKPENGLIVDHRDRNGLNCQRSNLRSCTKSENTNNKTPLPNRSSNYLGVCKNKDNKSSPWRAQLTKDGVQHHLGYYKTEVEAALAYNEGAKIHHKEFANLNIIP